MTCKKYYGRKALAIIRAISRAGQQHRKKSRRKRDWFCSKHMADRWFGLGVRIKEHPTWFVEAST